MRHIKEFGQLFENTRELTLEQKDWLDKCTKGTYSFNPKTGLVDVDESFNCSRQGLTDFKGVRFGYVSGSFICFSNRLTSLEGAPRRVKEYFNCGNNQLTSLDGAPQSVGGSFDCSNNFLISLEGAPQKVGGEFYFFKNPISNEIVIRVLRKMSDDGITLEQAVSDLWNDISEEDRIYLAKHHPDLPPEEKKEYMTLERYKKRII